MATGKTQGKGTRIRHSAEYKAQALVLAERIGVAAAVKQLGRHESQLYGGRSKARLQRDRGEAEQQLTLENVRLKRQLAEQAEELAILKKQRLSDLHLLGLPLLDQPRPRVLVGFR